MSDVEQKSEKMSGTKKAVVAGGLAAAIAGGAWQFKLFDSLSFSSNDTTSSTTTGGKYQGMKASDGGSIAINEDNDVTTNNAVSTDKSTTKNETTEDKSVKKQ